LTQDITSLRRTDKQEESAVLTSLQQVKQREEERIQESRDALKAYQDMISSFKDDIAREVGT
jgi:hypothetical protein